MDTLDKSGRSALMAKIRSTNTGPEIMVRRVAHKLGFRFRLHRRDLPGSPDVVFPRHRAAVFVHGCFWHRHEGCRRATSPKTNRDFWEAKFAANRKRDARAGRRLRRLGWRVLTIWECETGDADAVARRLLRFLGAPTGKTVVPTEARTPSVRQRSIPSAENGISSPRRSGPRPDCR